MFENLSHASLQEYWWIINSLLGSLLVFLMFVQGGQSLIFQIGKTEKTRTLIINTLGRKWELTFTTLVTFGGAMFASFPLFYSSSFGGAYWVWLAILFCFIIQAVSYEYRSKPANVWGAKTFEIFLFLNGVLGTFLIGVAVSTFFNGANFTLNDFNSVRWANPYRGLEALLNWHNLFLGFTVLFLARVLGAMYFIKTVDNQEVADASRKEILFSGVAFLFFFLSYIIRLLLMDGFGFEAETGVSKLIEYKYLLNYIEMPVVGILFLLGVVLFLYGLAKTLFVKNFENGFSFSGAGATMVVFSLLLNAGLNDTYFYPSLVEIGDSLSIRNASSSKYTLTAMSYVSLMVPFVIAYIVWAWRSINKEKINENLDESEEHVY
ncbi:MAG: cytochrome d ubiquinol oxidase subunit II [Marinifilaceae bacterium]|jgi:cytochrome d ubiquinol oxidase subunit II|nr:cytochrome d ubiquinol oxidase subunit II [Marinifilaceae bacterium]